MRTRLGCDQITYRYMTGRLRINRRAPFWMWDRYSPHMSGSKCQSNLRLRSRCLLQVRRTAGRYLPEPQSLLRVEMDVLPRHELCTDVNISGSDEGTWRLLHPGGTRFRTRVGHFLGRRRTRGDGGWCWVFICICIRGRSIDVGR